MPPRVIVKYREVRFNDKIVSWKLISNEGEILHWEIPSYPTSTEPAPITWSLSPKPKVIVS